eukprot:222384_1
MASEGNSERGVFPGLEFFTTLGTIAKRAAQDIQQINRELTQPSAAHDLQVDNLWAELHIDYNTAYNQSIQLQESLSQQQPLSDSVGSFYSMINWIKVETQRIEKQLQQFGYQPEDPKQYEYDLPLTPQQQQMYEQQQANAMVQHTEQPKEKTNEHHTEKEEQKEAHMDTNGAMDIDEDEPSDSVHNTNDFKLKLTQESEMSNTIESATNTIGKPQSIHKSKPIMPSTPGVPAYDKCKLFAGITSEQFYRSDNIPSKNINENDNNADEKHVSSTSTIALSDSASVVPKPYVAHNACPETPVLDTKFDMNAFRKNIGIPMDANRSLNDSLGSIPRLSSPKASLQSFTNKCEMNYDTPRKALAPITPTNIKFASQSSGNTDKTPITVSSFSVMNHKESSRMSVDDEVDTEATEDAKLAISYLTEKELSEIPSWITSQMGTLNEINKKIDAINSALKACNGIINKPQIKDLIGSNEVPMILLLTRTNRLKSDWCQGNSIYCLP